MNAIVFLYEIIISYTKTSYTSLLMHITCLIQNICCYLLARGNILVEKYCFKFIKFTIAYLTKFFLSSKFLQLVSYDYTSEYVHKVIFNYHFTVNKIYYIDFMKHS